MAEHIIPEFDPKHTPNNPVPPEIQERAQELYFLNGQLELESEEHINIQLALEKALIAFFSINETDPMDLEDDDLIVMRDGCLSIVKKFSREISKSDLEMLKSLGVKYGRSPEKKTSIDRIEQSKGGKA